MSKVDTVLEPVEALQAEKIHVENIRRSPANPRVFREPDPTVVELAKSIVKVGLVQPITVRPVEAESGSPQHEIVAGERRWRAYCHIVTGGLNGCAGYDDFQSAPYRMIPAFVRIMSAEAAYELTVTENLQREDLSPLEEANGVGTLVDSGRYTLDEIADKLGKPVSWVARRAKLRDLIPEWREAAADVEGHLWAWTAKHYEVIARFGPDVQQELLGQYNSHWNSHISAAELQKHTAMRLLRLSAAPWKITEAGPGVTGACAKCDKRTGCQPHLFEEETKGGKIDQCMDKICWGKKLELHMTAREKELRAQYPGLLLFDTMAADDMLPRESALKKRCVREQWRFDNARKNEEGAVPALIIDGKGCGTVKWKKLSVCGARSGGIKLDAGGNPAPKPLSERRAALEKRRTIRFIERVYGLLEKEIETPDRINGVSFLDIEAAVLTWGAESYNTVKCGGYQRPGERWRDLKKLKAATGDYSTTVFHQRMLMGVILKWLDDLRSLKRLEKPDAHVPMEICEFMGFDAAEIRAGIAEENREPKSWAGLNEDGTPKGGAR